MKQFAALLFISLLSMNALAEESDCSRALQQARQVAKKSSVDMPNDAFILSTLAAKKAKKLQAMNNEKSQTNTSSTAE